MATNVSVYNELVNKHDNNETRLILIGKTGVGKSSTANTILGRRAFKASSASKSVTKSCQSDVVERGERRIKVVDVPGFKDTDMSRIEEGIAIMECVIEASPGPHAILMVISIGRFTDEDQEAQDRFLRLFGQDANKFVVAVFTGLDNLEADGESVDEFIEDAEPRLKRFLHSINNRYIAVNNRKEDNSAFVEELLSKVNELKSEYNYYTNERMEKVSAELSRIAEKKLEEMGVLMENVNMQLISNLKQESQLALTAELARNMLAGAFNYFVVSSGAVKGAQLGRVAGPVGVFVGAAAGALIGLFVGTRTWTKKN